MVRESPCDGASITSQNLKKLQREIERDDLAGKYITPVFEALRLFKDNTMSEESSTLQLWERVRVIYPPQLWPEGFMRIETDKWFLYTHHKNGKKTYQVLKEDSKKLTQELWLLERNFSLISNIIKRKISSMPQDKTSNLGQLIWFFNSIQGDISLCLRLKNIPSSLQWNMLHRWKIISEMLQIDLRIDAKRLPVISKASELISFFENSQKIQRLFI